MASTAEPTNEATETKKTKGPIFMDVPIISEIGIIYPPAEMRNVIDKTAEFVFKNGIEFEEKIRNREVQNPKFSFLNRNDPYFKYYKHVYYEFTLYPNREKPPAKPSFLTTAMVQNESKTEQPVSTDVTEKHRTIIDLGDPQCPSSVLQPFEFFVESPPLSPVDLDIVKITAQFVAKNGRPFLQSLLQREVKNYIFDFLKPQHNIYPYFIKLVDQYSKILVPPRELLEELQSEAESYTRTLAKIRLRYEWIRYNDKERKKEFDQTLKEKNVLNSIDWHEFVVVETISFREDERNNLPPPSKIEQLGARIIAQERYDKNKANTEITNVTEKQEPIETVVAEDDEPPSKISAPNVMEDLEYEKNVALSKVKNNEKMMISPITGELVPASKLQEHIRLSLLDPRYKEQKQKFQEEKRQIDLMATAGPSVSSHLKELAKRRSDIFGPGHAETLIGKKLEEKKESFIKKSAPVHFDNTAPAPRPQPISTEKSNENQRLPPPLISRPIQPTSQQRVSLPPPLPSRNTVPSYSNQNIGPSYQSSVYPNDDRPKFDEELIPSDVFLNTYGGAPINIQVRIPLLPDLSQKHGWQLQGQIEHLTIELSDTIAALKSQICQKTGMPPSKQKILIGATRFGKDTTSLAYYNIHSNTYIALHLKERGGKK